MGFVTWLLLAALVTEGVVELILVADPLEFLRRAIAWFSKLLFGSRKLAWCGYCLSWWVSPLVIAWSLTFGLVGPWWLAVLSWPAVSRGSNILHGFARRMADSRVYKAHDAMMGVPEPPVPAAMAADVEDGLIRDGVSAPTTEDGDG